MQPDREELTALFASLTDGELFQRYVSGDLVELAQGLARAELLKRGIATPPAGPQPGEERNTPHPDLVTVATFLTSLEAHVLRARLEAEGIPAVVADDQMARIYQLLVGARVLVPEHYVEQAHKVKLAIAAGAYRIDEDEDVGSASP